MSKSEKIKKPDLMKKPELLQKQSFRLKDVKRTDKVTRTNSDDIPVKLVREPKSVNKNEDDEDFESQSYIVAIRGTDNANP